ncbi:MAG: 30S ribosomal protein S4 [Bacteroidetes bacterium]|nr:30S ribosomal protein S4 [Bacteroidota bacterium]
MARYKGPKTKISRRFGMPIYGPDKTLEKKNYPPGMHGPDKKRGRQSEYAVQLAEKQKVKYTYGILERQFYSTYLKASHKKGKTGEILLQLCETRLDNTVYRLGIAPTRPAARQLVTHRHITVNDRVVNFPSYNIRIGDIIGIRERSKSLELISNSLSNKSAKYPWLDWNERDMSGKLISYPTREQIPEPVLEHLIVELYSK